MGTQGEGSVYATKGGGTTQAKGGRPKALSEPEKDDGQHRVVAVPLQRVSDHLHQQAAHRHRQHR